MARRRNPLVFDLRPYGGAPMVNLASGQVTRRSGGSLARTPLTDGVFDVGNRGGLRILRNRRTNTMGRRDLVVDQRGRVVANIRPGSNPQLRFVGTGANRRLVVGRAGAPAPGAAPTGGGAGATRLTAGVTDDPNLIKSTNDPVLWRGRNQPNIATLNRQFGQNGWYVEQDDDGRYVVKRRDNSPYAAYNDYPWARRYLEGLDRGYDQFQSYITNTLTPAVTSASQALTAARLAGGNAYNTAIQNYANSAGTAASAITTPQVAGATGGTVVAPNQNALAAAQSMAASANAARNIDAGYRTSLGGLEAEKMGQSFVSSTLGYASGLLNQYSQKRQEERLKIDQFIEEQKAEAAQREIDLLRMDQSYINSLIVSGDRAAARDVTIRGQDLADARGRADDARQDRIDRGYLPKDLKDDYNKIPKGAGSNWRKNPNAIQDINGDWWLPKPDKAPKGSTRTTPSGNADLKKNFRAGWQGVKGKGSYPGASDYVAPRKPSFGPIKKNPYDSRIRAAAKWFVKNKANFRSGGKVDIDMIERFINESVPGISDANKKALMSTIRTLLKNG